MSSYNLSFFDKFVLCRGLQSSIPEPRISAIDIQATFEKAFWKLEPVLSEDNKELAVATLRSIALNYIKRKGSKPPKPLVRSIQKLKKRDDIVITKPDKGSGVVVMDKLEYIRLLNEASIIDLTKFDLLASRSQPQEEDHQNIIRFWQKKNILNQSCVKFYQKKWQTRSVRRDLAWPTYMAFPKRTKQLSRCVRSSQQLELTIMILQSG